MRPLALSSFSLINLESLFHHKNHHDVRTGNLLSLSLSLSPSSRHVRNVRINDRGWSKRNFKLSTSGSWSLEIPVDHGARFQADGVLRHGSIETERDRSLFLSCLFLSLIRVSDSRSTNRPWTTSSSRINDVRLILISKLYRVSIDRGQSSSMKRRDSQRGLVDAAVRAQSFRWWSRKLVSCSLKGDDCTVLTVAQGSGNWQRVRAAAHGATPLSQLIRENRSPLLASLPSL